MDRSSAEFGFASCLEGYAEAIRQLDVEELGGSQGWSPTDDEQILRVVGEQGTVLIAAKRPSVRVTVVNYSTPGRTVVVSSSDDACELDAVRVEGKVLVQIDTTVNVLEGMQLATQQPPFTPLIWITHRGAVRDLVGVVGLHQISGQLTSKGRSRRERPGQILEIAESSSDGKLVGVDVTRLRQAPHLQMLSELSVFSPDVTSLHELAVRFDRLTRSSRTLRGRTLDPIDSAVGTPQEHAHWFRDLHNAMQSMAVPASTRAVVRWCYTLLEHESIKPRWSPQRETRAAWARCRMRRETLESLGRWLYRSVGYGQRPSRAFLSWLAAAVGVTLWSAQCRVVEDGTIGWAKRYLEALLSPLGVLRLRSNEATTLLGEVVLEPVAYLLVGLPFIFFVIALREFFRSPLSQRS